MSARFHCYRKDHTIRSAGALLSAIILLSASQAFAGKNVARSCQPPPSINLTTIHEGKHSLGGDFKWRIVMKIKNGRVWFANTELSPGPSILIMPNGDHINLMGAMGGTGQKVYIRRSASDLKKERESMLPQSQKELSSSIASQTPTNPSKGGRTRVIDGRTAQLYIGISADGKTSFEYWLTSQFDDVALVKHAMKCANQAITNLPPKPDPADDLPGIIIEQVSKVDGKETSHSHLVSISRDPIPDEEFLVPAGYISMDEMRMQATQGGGQGVPSFPGMPNVPGVPVQH